MKSRPLVAYAEVESEPNVPVAPKTCPQLLLLPPPLVTGRVVRLMIRPWASTVIREIAAVD
jgi:hypothetical protein